MTVAWVQAILQFFAGFKARHFLHRHVDNGACFGISALFGLSYTLGEDTEAANLNFVAPRHGSHDAIESGVYDSFCLPFGLLRLFSEHGDKLRFRHIKPAFRFYKNAERSFSFPC